MLHTSLLPYLDLRAMIATTLLRWLKINDWQAGGWPSASPLTASVRRGPLAIAEELGFR
jgi:hypothetical protein